MGVNWGTRGTWLTRDSVQDRYSRRSCRRRRRRRGCYTAAAAAAGFRVTTSADRRPKRHAATAGTYAPGTGSSEVWNSAAAVRNQLGQRVAPRPCGAARTIRECRKRQVHENAMISDLNFTEVRRKTLHYAGLLCGCQRTTRN